MLPTTVLANQQQLEAHLQLALQANTGLNVCHVTYGICISAIFLGHSTRLFAIFLNRVGVLLFTAGIIYGC